MANRVAVNGAVDPDRRTTAGGPPATGDGQTAVPGTRYLAAQRCPVVGGEVGERGRGYPERTMGVQVD